MLTKFIVEQYKKTAHGRQEDTGDVFYFSNADFDGLRAEPYDFTSSMGHELRGFLYSYENPIPGRLIVFDHGMGAGHWAYVREIEMLCKRGYLVLAYDHTGCACSGGEGTNGMAQSLHDLDDCFKVIKADPRFAGYDFSVVGHSWGGFSTLNISALHPEISHVVVFSGFVSVELLIASYFGGILKGCRKPIMALEREKNPDYVDYNAVESLKKSSAKVLLIYSDDDSVVSRTMHFDPLKEALSGRENIRFLLVDGKDHNPTYTAEAVKYKNEFFRELTRRKKEKLLVTDQQKREFMAGYDWRRMTTQDEEVWKRILDALKEE
jgi:pimeloyl-ACP methyl ester carboxylesterase